MPCPFFLKFPEGDYSGIVITKPDRSRDSGNNGNLAEPDLRTLFIPMEYPPIFLVPLEGGTQDRNNLEPCA